MRCQTLYVKGIPSSGAVRTHRGTIPRMPPHTHTVNHPVHLFTLHLPHPSPADYALAKGQPGVFFIYGTDRKVLAPHWPSSCGSCVDYDQASEACACVMDVTGSLLGRCCTIM
ncbi:hypothetical protein PAPYR_7725 [Paratrimastix pyriformis]|uniref:Uncharacterized protein n=1 Tax=Paratrimastix pyriformis TaxID=342808 RepID=A0ABQ8UC97_9EUKA|nr:hypothetical protein PAPYR_7725 [Paratrimastix pyriformis]